MEYNVGGTVFDDWKIIRLIGEGGFGKVYEIQKNNYGVNLKSALKVIHIPHSPSDLQAILQEGMDEVSVTSYFHGFVQEIVNEISIMTSLKGHTNIVSCEDYSVVESEDTIGWDILIRMELLTPLQEYLERYQMKEKDVVELGIDLCQALVACQKKGLIHRDIKPGNIFVNEEGQFKLGDFGIARSAEKTAGGLSKKGTEGYMAPEVYLGKPYGPSVDIYSVGIVLYKLMNNNRLPFLPPVPQPIKFSDREDSLRRRISGENLQTPELASKEFAEIILKASAYEPKDRYHTVEEMLKSLQVLKKLSDESRQNMVCDSEQKNYDEKTLPLFDDCSEDRTLIEIQETNNDNTPFLDIFPIKDDLEDDHELIHKTSKRHRIIVFVLVLVFLMMALVLLVSQVLNNISQTKDPFNDMERIYVYSESNYGVSVFESAARGYHAQLEEATEAEYKELTYQFEDTIEILQGLETYEVVRHSNDRFIEYGPCALYQTEDGDARLFQVLLYESGYKMMECGFDSELSFNHLNFYIVTNLSAEDEVGVTFQADSYKIREIK